MDSLTHIVLGAVIGEGIAGKKIGKQALLIGALAQSLPDIDSVASLWLNSTDDLLAHRGITHSILFAILSSLILAAIFRWVHRTKDMAYRQWIIFLGTEIFTHILLDACNNYGTGWFEPFNHYRVSFNILFVADPFFTIGSLIATVALLILKTKSNARQYWVTFGLCTSFLYITYALYNKTVINTAVDKNLDRQHIVTTRWFTTPTALNTWLWYVVAEDDKGYHLGYRSVFDSKDSIHFRYFPRNEAVLKELSDQPVVKTLERFAQGYYTIDNHGDTLVFNDLRFGQIMGWRNPDARFVFHYYLQHPDANLLVIQRGRFEGWDKQSVHALITRIKGN
jgi:inner membrane protein